MAPGPGGAHGPLGARGCTPGPSSGPGQGARGSPFRSVDVASEGPGLPEPTTPSSIRVGAAGEAGTARGPMPAALQGPAPRPSLGDLAEGSEGTRRGLCVREGLRCPGSPVCEKGKTQRPSFSCVGTEWEAGNGVKEKKKKKEVLSVQASAL